ncbi:unnamed protein product [Gongylonema pulchrum]|uniref:BRO1 domain-containing protein n=1 Tax=Gongylonema pulchrum TaxID=637853 RepID=A0A183EKA0_9BILA|nr:unnamed protein product [Gongylonema pulchrum]
MLNYDSPTSLAFPVETRHSLALMTNYAYLLRLFHELQECAKALQQDKSSSLTDAKNALEFGMFVGEEAQLNDENDAQAWIDSQRADYVNFLVPFSMWFFLCPRHKNKIHDKRFWVREVSQ